MGAAPARLLLDEREFRFAMNQDAMATEKLAEGIRLFAKDLYALRALVGAALARDARGGVMKRAGGTVRAAMRGEHACAGRKKRSTATFESGLHCKYNERRMPDSAERRWRGSSSTR